MAVSGATIDSLFREEERYSLPEKFRRHAMVHDEGIPKAAAKDMEGFWAERAKELTWVKPWDKVLDWKPPFAGWFAQRGSEEPNPHIA